jgi:hypothetical protein
MRIVKHCAQLSKLVYADVLIRPADSNFHCPRSGGLSKWSGGALGALPKHSFQRPTLGCGVRVEKIHSLRNQHKACGRGLRKNHEQARRKHARRNFFELVEREPEETRLPLEFVARVYANDSKFKKRPLADRLTQHQRQSGPLMASRRALPTASIRLRTSPRRSETRHSLRTTQCCFKSDSWSHAPLLRGHF